MKKKFKFPDGFFWGASTSAPQVEGGNNNDWSGWGAGRACDHYHRFGGDFDIAKELNHNAHRFSIEWSRIEPKEGRIDEKEIEHYHQVVRALKERGLEPFVTLCHFTL
ncbi:MAG: family 1 glycosylhydrolase, partial [Patescibacteria group bacterium]